MKCCQTFYAASADRRTNRVPQKIYTQAHPNVSKNNSSTNIRSNKPKCGKCKNHGVTVNLQGHSANCPNKDCFCEFCNLQEQRRYIAKMAKECERSGVFDPYRAIQAFPSYGCNLPDKNLVFSPMNCASVPTGCPPVQLTMPSSPLPRTTPDATPRLGLNDPGRPSKVAYPGSPRTISVHSTSTVDDFLSSSSEGSSPPRRQSAFREVPGRLDPSKKDKAVKDFENSLKKLGDPDYRQLLLGHALLEICKYDMEDVSRRIQSGTQELLDRMNTILGIDSDDDYVDVNFYTDDEDDEDEDEIPEVEPCPRSLE